jgi:hypothetical protein
MKINQLLKVGLYNLVIVAILGVIMRYKIGFELPIVNQKNLQLAHSGFAFSGFISIVIMSLMVKTNLKWLSASQIKFLESQISLSLFSAYIACIALIFWGYGVFSVVFQVAGLLFNMLYIIAFIKTLHQHPNKDTANWYKAAGIFFFISVFASFWLIYMLFSGNKTQHSYLGATYWFLHFQYNGWFFFACIGLFFQWLDQMNIDTKLNRTTFLYFAISCIPAYGLSALWLNLPVWMYVLVVISAILQCIGVIKFFSIVFNKRVVNAIHQNPVVKLLFIFSFGALLVKILLQMGSTIPFLSKLAFGFRPIVIAYLHLVLLAFTALFLIAYTHLTAGLNFSKAAILATKVFAIFVILNEMVLGVQGIASLSYQVIPFVNEALLIIAGGMLFASVVMMPSSQKIGQKLS